MPEQQLYFIAIIPPEPIYSQVQAYKEEFANTYGSKAALKSPPHITLHMPFRLKPKKEEKLISVLNEVSKDVSAFELILNGFGQFNQRTIFIDIEENDRLHELFKRLMKTMKIDFNIFNADYKNRGYNPHLTLAFRDLKKDAFKRAWPTLKDESYHAEFLTKAFTLLKHNGKHWEVFKSFYMS